MALFSIENHHNLIYSWLKLISSFSSDYDFDQFNLLQILSDASLVLGFCLHTLLMSIGKIFEEF
jgi:hypothetical protein